MSVFRKSSSRLDDRAAAKWHRWVGLMSIVVASALLVSAAWVFITPFGGRPYAAHMASSGGVRPGDDIRVAGVSVGKVLSVRLDRTEVLMTFTAVSSVFVGSNTTLQIKLLTPLGGRYVALHPDGSTPLGTTTIPSNRVELQFTITDILQMSEPAVKKVDGQVIHDTFSEIAGAMNKYPNALRDILQATNTMTDSLSRIRDDYHRVLDVAKEYSTALAANRRELTATVKQLGVVFRFAESKGDDLVYFFASVAEILRTLKRLAVFYNGALEPIVNSIDDLFDITYAHPERVGQALDGIGQILRIVMPMLHGEGIVLNDKNRVMDENHVEPRPGVCVPNIFRKC